MIRILSFCLLLGFSSLIYGQERIHLQYNQEKYAPGDTIWFKAFLRKGDRPSFTSHNLYVQLQDIDGRRILENKIPVIGATATGHFVIPDSLRNPWYVIRAFTPETIVYDEPFIYKHLLQLGNYMEKNEHLICSVKPEAGLFPENIPTRFFVKTLTEKGKPVAITGTIRDRLGNQIIHFQTKNSGTTSFVLTSKPGEQYDVFYRYADKDYSIPLPVADSMGIGLEIIKKSSGYRFVIKRTTQRAADTEQIQLSVKHQDNPSFFKEYTLTKEKNFEILFNLPSSSTGFYEFILENKQGELIGSRLLIHEPEKLLSPVSLDTLSVSLQPRSLNRFHLRFPDTLPRTYAVSVTAIEADRAVHTPDPIFFNMLIPGNFLEDLSGLGYPFGKLMQTQINEEVLNEVLAFYHYKSFSQTKAPLHDPYLIRLSGTVFQSKTKEVVRGGRLSIWLMNDRKQLFLESPVDDEGKFAVDSIVFFGDAKVYYTYTNSKGRIQDVSLIRDTVARDTLFDRSPDYRHWFTKLIDTSKLYMRETTASESGTTLAAVTVFSKIKLPPLVEKYVSERFRYDGTSIFDMSKTNTVASPLDLILTRIPGIILERGSFGIPGRLKTKTYYGFNTAQWELDIFIDERRATVEEVETLQTQEIALMRYVKTGFPVGAVFIYLKKADERRVNIPAAANFFSLKGYSPLLNFRKVDYALINNHSNSTDNRTTWLWNSGIYLGQPSDDQLIEFYTNESARGYQLIIEGLDIHGRMFRKLVQFNKQ